MKNGTDTYQIPTDTPVKNASYFRARARESLKGRWGLAIGAFIVAAILGGLSTGVIGFSLDDKEWISAIQELFGKAALTDHTIYLLVNFAIDAVFSLVFALFVGAPIWIGYSKLTLSMVDDTEKPAVGMLFRYFSKCYGKSLLLRLLLGLIMFAVMLPASALGVYIVYRDWLVIYVEDPDAMLALGVVLAAFACSVAGAIVTIVLSLRYALAGYILADYPNLSAIDALRNSGNLMRGNKWRLFCLQLSFIGWLILSVLSCGIGLLWSIPYMNNATAAFYDEVSHRKDAREVEFPSLNPDDYDPNATI